MIADVVFDVPLEHPFSYRIPEGWALTPGQRVLAPLRGRRAWAWWSPSAPEPATR